MLQHGLPAAWKLDDRLAINFGGFRPSQEDSL